MSKFAMFLIFFYLIYSIFCMTENTVSKDFSKYEKDQYIKFFKISDSLILSTEKEQTNYSFFKRLISFISLAEIKITESYIYSFKNEINFNRILIPNIEEKYTPIKENIKIYYKLDSEKNFVLIEEFTFKELPKNNIILLKNEIECSQVKIDIKIPKIYENKINEKEIIFLSSETEILNENIINVFDKKDYRMLTLSKEYNKEEFIANLENESKKYKLSDYAKFYINRIKSVYTGAISYDPQREFTTNKNSESNILYQRGDIDKYARNTLKMTFAGTNRQSTGIYGISNQTITVFVKKGNTNDPLPSLRIMQHIGHWRNWLGKTNYLKEGEQTITVDDFKITEDYTIETFLGGPIYLINPYTSKEQSQNLTVYIEGGELFPIFRLNDDEEKYKNDLEAMYLKYKKDKEHYFDLTELVGLRAIMTLKASDAYNHYITQKKSPQENLLNWDLYLKKLFTYDGIQFDKTLPFYDEKNNYLNINIRHVQPYALAYAFTEHIGISYQDWIDSALFIEEKDIGWGFPHEIGHMMDIGERTVGETSNNMIAKYSETYLQNDGTWGPDRQENKILYLTPDDIDPLVRGCQADDKTTCKGFLTNIPLNYLVFWDLESLYHGYWAQIDNMYRYNNTLSNKLTKEEKFVYFSNIVLGFDLGYYFTRWGLSFSNGQSIFDESKTNSEYKSLMQKAINDKIVDTKTKKKYWYIDYKEYNYMNDIGLGCYQDKEEYNIQIVQITNPSKNKYTLSLPKVKCPGHLGFEIYESDKLIGFTYEYTYTDETVYSSGYTPKYKIIAYDRLLDTSNESEYKSFTSKLALKQINLDNPLNEEEYN